MERLPRLGFSLVAGVGLLAGGLASFGSVSAHTTPSNSALTSAGSYVSVTPYRVADTRTSSALAGGATLNVQVAGAASGVPVGAAAAVLNVTAVNPTAAGFLTVFPAGTTMPTVSNLNFAAGTIVPNLVTVGLSASGAVSVYLNTGSTNVVVDVEGYYTSTVAASGLYNPINPSRVFGSLTIGGSIGAAATQAVTVAGTSVTDGVPASASAVVLNVTAAHATAPSFLTVFPAGVTMPTASNLNFGAQAPLQAIANRVTVGVGTSGQIDVYNLQGTVAVDVDVDGYYASTGSPFVAITPIRVADTRTATKVGSETAIAAATTEAFTLATPDIPATAAGVAMNLTVVPGAAPGYLTSYPTSATTPPVASDVNWTASESPAVPNFTIANTAGTGIAQNVDVANSYFTTGATVDVLADAFGYFGASTAPVPVGTTYTLTVTALPTTISIAPGTAGLADTSKITAVVTGPGQTPITGDPLLLTSNCGTFSAWAGGTTFTAPDNTTTAAGVGTATYTASTTPGTCTVTVREADQGLSASATIIQQPIAYSLSLAASALTLPNSPSATSTVTATVDLPDGSPASGVTVTFSDTGGSNPTNTCEATLPAGPFVTGAGGTTPLTYTATAISGFCTITATADAGPTPYPSAVVSLDQTNGTYVGSTTIGVTADPVTIDISPSVDDTSNIYVAVNGPSGMNPGDPLMVTTTCGTVAYTFLVTSPTGGVSGAPQSYDVFTAPTTPGTCTVTAQEAYGAMTASTTITIDPVVYSISLAASPLALQANGVTTSIITATVLNASGTAASGIGVTFTCASYPNVTTNCGTYPTGTLITNAIGQVTFTYISGTAPSFATITGTEHYDVTGSTGSVSLDQMSI
jgi:hypothetical protein